MSKRFLYILALIGLFFSCTNRINHPQSSEPKLKPPLMGWSSWNNFHTNINEKIVKSQADAMLSQKLMDFGYKYIIIDDGFFGGRDENGKILSHKKRFPNGMKSLAEYIHSKGINAGIYSDAGINTCASYWDKDTIGVGMGLFGHDVQDLTTYLKEWDYDFIKIDWCGADWLNLDEETRYTKIEKIARKIKPEVVFFVCRWKFPGKWVANIANAWRISSDLSNNFASVLKTIDQNADLWPYASYGHYNDMDMLQIGRGMTYEEDKTHFSMWCLMHSPLILGNDLTTLSDETKQIITNKELIAINQSRFVYQARRVVDYGELEVWAKPLISTMSGQIVVALLNRTNEQQSIKFGLKSVGINPAACYTTKDLWSKEIKQSECNDSLSRKVPPHGVVVLKIEGKSLPYNVFQYKDRE